MEQTQFFRRLAAFLLAAANVALIFALLAVRAQRIAFTDVSVFTPEFAALFMAAGILAAASVWLAAGQRWAAHRWRAGIAGLGLAGGVLLLSSAFVPNVAPYTPPFVLWWGLALASLVMAAAAPHLEKLPIRRILRPAAQLAAGLLVTLFILEGGLRLWFTFFGTAADKVNYLLPIEDVLTRFNRFNGQPYFNFGLSPAHPDHNARGYRGPEIVTPKPSGTYRIFTIGGSTTYGVSLQNNQTYPAQLQRRLHERGYTNVEVINAGVPQYATYDNLIQFQFRILDDQPDMILTYEGINDVVTRLVDPARYNGLNAMRGIWDTSSIQQSPLVSVRFISQLLGWSKPPSSLDSILYNVSDVQRCSDAVTCQALGLTPDEVLERNPPIYFERNMRHLIALAQLHDVEVVLSTWAYFPEESNGSTYMMRPYMQQGVAQHNAITRQLAAELGLPLIDLADRMPYGAQYWLDGLHMTPEGAVVQATLYADFLADNSLLPAP